MSDLLQQIQKGTLAPVYYLYGEAYERDRVVAALKHTVVPDPSNEFGCDRFDAQEVTPQQIFNAAQTMPFLGGKRYVQVRNCDAFKAEDLNALIPYVKDPAPFTVLVMIADKADLRAKFFKEVPKGGGVVEKFEPLKDRQVSAWIQTEAKRAKIALQPGVAEQIASRVGTDKAQLATTLEQLRLFCGKNSPITLDAVETMLVETRERSIFELTNALGRGDHREALLVLKRMMDNHEPAVMIVTMLARHLRQLWLAKRLLQERKPNAEIASTLGVHPYFLEDILKQSKRFKEEQLKKIHDLLCEADALLKSTSLPEEMILTRIVLAQN